MLHHLRVYFAALRLEVVHRIQYRADFIVGLFVNVGWTGLSLIFISALFGNIKSLAGWSYNEMILVLGLYRFADGIINFLFYRSLKQFSKDIRRGNFDMLMTKPVNLQFFLSIRFPALTDFSQGLVGLGLVFYSLNRLQVTISPLQFLSFLAIFVCGIIFHYAFFFMITTLNFWLVKVDNFRQLVHSVVALTRFPTEAFGPKISSFLTFVLPLAVIVSFPTKVLLGRSEVWHLPFAASIAILSLFLSHRLLNRALRLYSSAGG
mgnify:FL=1